METIRVSESAPEQPLPAPAPPPVVQALALQRAIGNRATRQVLSRSNKANEIWFAIRHPFVAGQIGGATDEAETEMPSTASLAVRFSVNLRTDRQTSVNNGGITENAQKEGSEVNAMRHTVWNAINASRFGVSLAQEAADSHEEDPHAIDNQDATTQTFATWLEADQGCDLRNNIIGRSIGAANSRSSAKQLATLTLRTFHDSGLYVVESAGGGRYRAVLHRITDQQFNDASQKLNNLSEIGLTPDSQRRWQAAHDERMRQAWEDATSGLYD
jgi:uncharacterized protein DUF6973